MAEADAAISLPPIRRLDSRAQVLRAVYGWGGGDGFIRHLSDTEAALAAECPRDSALAHDPGNLASELALDPERSIQEVRPPFEADVANGKDLIAALRQNLVFVQMGPNLRTAPQDWREDGTESQVGDSLDKIEDVEGVSAYQGSSEDQESSAR